MSPFEKAAVAVAAASSGTLLQFAVAPLVGLNVPFAFYFPALLVASIVGGMTVGFAALSISLVAVWTLFIGPPNDYELKSALPVIVLAASGSLVVLSSALLRHAVLELKARRAAERTLLRELNHRIKNVYSVIQAMSMQTARSAESLADYQQRFGARLQALASAQDVLVNNVFDSASLRDIVKAALAPFTDTRSGQITISPGPEVHLDPQTCTAFALALHELGTNAMKYGALADANGRVRVEWQFDGETRRFDFAWHETGVQNVSTPSHKGFGTRLIEQTFAQEGERRINIHYRSGGLTCEMSCRLRAHP